MARLLPERRDRPCRVGESERTLGDLAAQIGEGLQGLGVEVLAGAERRGVGLAERPQRGVVVEREEQREGVALLGHLAHPVRGGDEAPARPVFEHVADVDDQGSRHGRGIDPFASLVHHLEPRPRGEQQGEAFVIGVGADPGGVCRGGVMRVVDQAQLAGWQGDQAGQRLGRLAQRAGEAAEQPAADREDRGVVGHHILAETGQVRPLVGPQHRVAGWHGRRGEIEREVEGLLAVGSGAGRAELLLALGHITAMVGRTADVARPLGRVGQREEPPRGLLEALDHRRGDAVAGNVEEADLACCAVERRDRGRLGRGIAPAQRADVDHRDRGEGRGARRLARQLARQPARLRGGCAGLRREVRLVGGQQRAVQLAQPQRPAERATGRVEIVHHQPGLCDERPRREQQRALAPGQARPVDPPARGRDRAKRDLAVEQGMAFAGAGPGQPRRQPFGRIERRRPAPGKAEPHAVPHQDHRDLVLVRHEQGCARGGTIRGRLALPVLDVIGLDAVFDQQRAVGFKPPAIAERRGPEVDQALPLGEVPVAPQPPREAFLLRQQRDVRRGQFGEASGRDPPGQGRRLAQVDEQRRALQPVDPGGGVDRLARLRQDQPLPQPGKAVRSAHRRTCPWLMTSDATRFGSYR